MNREVNSYMNLPELTEALQYIIAASWMVKTKGPGGVESILPSENKSYSESTTWRRSMSTRCCRGRRSSSVAIRENPLSESSGQSRVVVGHVWLQMLRQGHQVLPNLSDVLLGNETELRHVSLFRVRASERGLPNIFDCVWAILTFRYGKWSSNKFSSRFELRDVLDEVFSEKIYMML